MAFCPAFVSAFSIAVINPNAEKANQAVNSVDKTQLAALKKYDVIVFIDASRSMRTADCSSGQSRWQWCREQTMALKNSLAKPMDGHMKLVAFSDNFTVYPNVDWNSIASFFAGHRPQGNTGATRAIKSQLDQYFASRKADRKSTRPLLIAMITDGLPDKPQSLQEAIVDATQKMDDAKEIAITFLQVGTDQKATRYLQELDECLISRKARYDVVTTKTYEQLNADGLTKALLQSVSDDNTVALK